MIDTEAYQMLQHALKEAKNSKLEAFEESCRRKKAEIAAIEVARKVSFQQLFFILTFFYC